MEWIKLNSRRVVDIKYRRKFVRQFLQRDDNRIVDIYCSGDKQMYFAYVLDDFHVMWRYSFSFMHEIVSYHIELL